jgi:TPR repeat protein
VQLQRISSFFVGQDRKAINWISAAAVAGNATAMRNLAFLYEHGRGVKKDTRQAINWYRKAAMLGETDSKEALKRLDASE